MLETHLSWMKINKNFFSISLELAQMSLSWENYFLLMTDHSLWPFLLMLAASKLEHKGSIPTCLKRSKRKKISLITIRTYVAISPKKSSGNVALQTILLMSKVFAKNIRLITNHSKIFIFPKFNKSLVQVISQVYSPHQLKMKLA